MYVDYETFRQFEKQFDEAFYSPGWVASLFGVSRQAVQQWITNDIITAHRYNGKEGSFIIIQESEFPKIREYRKDR